MAVITLKDFHLGGILDGHYQTNQNSLLWMQGFDAFSEKGILQTSRKLAKDSGSSITGVVNQMVMCSDGTTYIFMAGGAVWQRTSTPVYTNVYSGGGGGWGSNDILNAAEHNGYIYIATATTLYKWQIGTAWTFGAGVTSVGSFTAGDGLYHPMLQKIDALYIGDGRYIAQVGATGTFTANAFDLTGTWRITCLGETSREVVIGTTTQTNTTGRSRLFTWNTYSPLCSESYLVNEGKVNAIFNVGGSIVISAGYSCAFYQVSNYQLEKIKQLPLRNNQATGWDYESAGSSLEVLPNSIMCKDGRVLFGLSTVSGSSNATWLGVYSFGSSFAGEPPVITMPYITSTNTQSMRITSIVMTPLNTILVAWVDASNSTYGIDTYASGIGRETTCLLSTGFFALDRRISGSVTVSIPYRSIPSSWTVSGNILTVDETTYTLSFEDDSVHKCIKSQVKVQDLDTFKIEVSISGSATGTAWAIESIIIETE